MRPPILELERLTKSFGGTQALAEGALELYPGQVTALLGENGAGKSTLVKILSGVLQPDGGAIRIDGHAVRIGSPQAASKLGISVIHQESVLFDHLSVAENIFIAALPVRHGLVRWRRMRRRAAALLAQLEAPPDPDTLVGELSIAQKHLVQIARALCFDARILILDEATAALSASEALDLLDIVRRLRDDGRAVLYISHKLEEMRAIADRYVVFRDGACVGSGLAAHATLEQLVALMVGRAVQAPLPRVSTSREDELLRVERLTRREEFSDVSFSVSRGEILGIYGLTGAGRSEVMQTLFGLTQPDGGRLTLAGRAMRFAHPDQAIRAGLAYVPEDRQSQGLILARSIAANMALPNLRRFARLGFLRRVEQTASATEWARRLQIKCRSVQDAAGDLSGGNQQKVVIAKWLLTAPRVLIMDEPTKGIDVGAKATVHRLIAELAAQGVAIVIVSSELPEVMELADRVLVMRHGRVRASFARHGAPAEDILRAAAGA